MPRPKRAAALVVAGSDDDDDDDRGAAAAARASARTTVAPTPPATASRSKRPRAHEAPSSDDGHARRGGVIPNGTATAASPADATTVATPATPTTLLRTGPLELQGFVRTRVRDAAAVNAEARAFAGEPEFAHGAVRRVRLRNFCCYTDTEFRCGPRFNLIVGPNGTGKSSIVAAICLALTGATSAIDPERPLASYIGLGTAPCVIDLDLQGPTPDTRYTITRELLRSPSSARSQWTLDGRPTDEAAVRQLVRRLNIDLSDPTQFSAQRLAAQIAKLSPEALLRTVLANAGDYPDIVAQHDAIVAAQREHSVMSSRIAEAQTQLAKLIAQKEQSKKAQARIDEIKHLQEQVRTMNAYMTYRTFAAKQSEARQLQKQRDACAQRVADATARLAPLRQTVAAAATRRDQAFAEEARRRREMDRRITRMETLASEFDMKDLEIDTARSRIESAMQRRNNTAHRIEEVEGQVADQTAVVEQRAAALVADGFSLEDGVVVDSPALVAAKAAVEAARTQRTTCEQDVKDARAAIARLTAARKECQTRIDKRQLELRDAATPERIRREVLTKLHNSHEGMQAYDGIQRAWAAAFPDAPPPVMLGLAIQVPDARYAAVVEAALHNLSYGAYIFVDEAGVAWFRRVSERYGRIGYGMCDKPLSAYPCPQSRAWIQAQGFDGYLIDFIEADDVTLGYLCSKANIHRTPVALADVDQARARASGLTAWYAGGCAVAIKAAYGREMVQQVGLHAPRIFLDRGTSTAAAADLRDKLAREQQQLAEITADLTAREAELPPLDAALRQASDAFHAAQARAAPCKRPVVAYTDARNVLDRLQMQLSRERVKHTQAITQVEEAQRAVAAARAQSVQRVIQHGADVEANAALWTQLIDAFNQRRDAEAAWAQPADALAQYEAQHQILQRAYSDLDAQTSEAFKWLEDHKAELREVKRSFPPTKYHALHQTSRALSLEQLQTQQSTRVGKLAGLVNAGAMDGDDVRQTLEQLNAEIARYEAEQQPGALHAHSDRLKAQLTAYARQLHDLVTRLHASFAAAFMRIINLPARIVLGHVDAADPRGASAKALAANASAADVAQHLGDVGKLGLTIQVTFREGMPPTPLSALQSGGECALSQMLFIIALKEISNAPLFLADECNQGMDSRNEAATFRELLELGRSAKSPQMFYISPRSIADLDINDSCHVLITFYGRYLHRRFGKGFFDGI
ncbi:hypothetical protein CXG81DRAFT_23921 [Caulochytrium protostelioides]|uniref:Structural maintenance of chromosomes protein 5 n=1 Tax=Caulochytrium protostelioides TaxID=1555241 RepID=A0A4P9XD67_9FUNG|nr:hypothetical protein CXG81DRAFT_23921 [Caulochytrium protostelioides]|eukprot:RKP03395.1 hypothetical protein CXG81DRAFT_23921 [Caulochytrium protostelioides]